MSDSTPQMPPKVHDSPITPMPGTFLGHPRGLFLLFFVEMWERFSYYGMRTLLVLYLTSVLAVHQVNQGVYQGEFRFAELRDVEPSEVGTGGASQVEAASTSWTTVLAVGEATPADLAARSAAGQPVLSVSRLVPVEVPVEGGGTRIDWVASTAQDAAIVSAGERGRPDSFDLGESEFRFEITNTSTEPVTVRVEATANQGGKPLYSVNGSAGASEVQVLPLGEGEGRQDGPTVVTIRANTHDSGRGWSDAGATNLSGWYTGLAYLLPLFGGIIADKLIGTHRSMVVGGILIALGHIALAVSGQAGLAFNDTGMNIFVFGMALVIIGTGHFKPTVSVMVGQLYAADDPRRDGAFSIFYMGVNLGAFLQGIIVGILGETVGWHYGFGAAAVGMILSLVAYVLLRPRVIPTVGLPPEGSKFPAWTLIPGGIALSALAAVLFHVGGLNAIDEFVSIPLVTWTIGGAALAWMIYFSVSQKREDRGPVISIFLFTLLNALFWLGFEQASTSINLFTDRNTDRNFLGLFEMPTTAFQSINPFFIITLAPIFSLMWIYLGKRRKNPSQPVKIGLGLVFLGVGYMFMTWAGMIASQNGAMATMWLVVATYFWHTVGELFISPTGLSYVTKAAPKKSVSLLMGVYFMSSFVANLMGGKVAGLVGRVESGDIDLPWSLGGQADFFMAFVVASVGVGVLVLLVSPLLKRLTGGRE